MSPVPLNPEERRLEKLAERRRFMFAAACGIIVLLVGMLSGKNWVELYEYVRGSMMTYETNSPFPVSGRPIYPGSFAEFVVTRNSDFPELESNWTMYRVSDRNNDGEKEADRVDGGRNHRDLILGKNTYNVEVKMPDWLTPGEYFFVYNAKLQWRTYSRIHSSRTVNFTVLPPPEKP